MNGRNLAPGAKERSSFGKIRSFLPLPNLIDVQRKSYEDFLQMDLLPKERQDVGLQAVFKSVLPFSDFRETCALHAAPAPGGRGAAASKAWIIFASPVNTVVRQCA